MLFIFDLSGISLTYFLDYTSYEALSSALQSKTVKAVLIDSFVAAQRPNLFGSDKARVNKIIKSTKAYGFVPGKALTADDNLIKCFRSYVEQSKQAISADVEANTNTLTVSMIFHFHASLGRIHTAPFSYEN